MSMLPTKEKPPQKNLVTDKREIFNNIMEGMEFSKTFLKNDHQVKVASRVMDMYFKLMYEALFEGKQVKIPGMGNIAITYEQVRAPQQIRYHNQVGEEEKEKGRKYFNHKTIGMIASFRFDGSGMINKSVRFRAPRAQRKKLSRLLFETDFAKTIEEWQ